MSERPSRPLLMRAATRLTELLGKQMGFFLVVWDNEGHANYAHSRIAGGKLAPVLRVCADKLEGPRLPGDASGALPPGWQN